VQLSGCTNHNHTLDKEAGLFLLRRLLAYREEEMGKEQQQQQQHSVQGEAGTTGTGLECVNQSSSIIKFHPDPVDNEVPTSYPSHFLPANMSIFVEILFSKNIYVLS
jgi:hypothetical protein